MSGIEALVAFLHARLDEDEAEINKHDGDEYFNPDGYQATRESGYPALPILTIGKARALRDVEAKRRILAWAERWMPAAGLGGVFRGEVERLVKWLALPYADHPDFREERRP